VAGRVAVEAEHGQVWPPSASGRVEPLVALGPPHAGWSIGFSDSSGPAQALAGALIFAMLALLAVAAVLASGLAGRLTSDVSRVRAKIEELSRGELGDPLRRAAVHSAEVRGL